jgi:hypothetical protein
MSIQVVDFSNINNVLRDGIALTQIVIDGVTLWTSNYVGQTWQQKGQSLFGASAGDQLGTSVSLSGDGSRLAVGAPKSGSDGVVRVYFWNGSFWEVEQEIVGPLNPQPTSSQFGASVFMSDDGLDLLICAPYYDNSQGEIWHYTRSGTDWSQSGSIGSATNGTQLGVRGAIFADNGVFVSTSASAGVKWNGTFGSGSQIGGTSGFNVAMNTTDGTVVAINEPYLTRNGFDRAGEIRVYEGAIGVKPSSLKGLPITGTAQNAYLGGSGLNRTMHLDAAGDRLFAQHSNTIHVYDFIGGLWSLSHTILPPAGFPSPTSINITSDGLKLTAAFLGFGVVVYAENGGVWDIINAQELTTPLVYARAVTDISDDGTHIVGADLLDNTNGSQAGGAIVYTLV